MIRKAILYPFSGYLESQVFSTFVSQSDDHTHNFIARTWLRMYHAFHGERTQARAISEVNLVFAQKTEDPMLIWEAYADLGSANFVMGDLKNAIHMFDSANEVQHIFDAQIPLSDQK